MLCKSICIMLFLLLGLITGSQIIYATAIDPARDLGPTYERLPFAKGSVGPELILLNVIPAGLFPDCEADDSGLLPIIVYVFLPSRAGEPVAMIAELACRRAIPWEIPTDVSSTPLSVELGTGCAGMTKTGPPCVRPAEPASSPTRTCLRSWRGAGIQK